MNILIIRHKLLNSATIPVLLFFFALMVRTPSLGTFLTVDESSWWVARSHQFVSGLMLADHECPPAQFGREFPAQGLGCTFQAGYPGVTTMWGGGLGLMMHYWQSVRPTGIELRSFLDAVSVNPVDPVIIAPMRLPFVVLNSLFIPFFYILIKRLLTPRIALAATLLLALSPFHIALSRVIHHDALTTTFMLVSLLTMIGYWLKGWPWYWLLVSGVFAGFGFLTKSISWFMAPYAVIVGSLGLYFRWQSGDWRGWAELWKLAFEGVMWGATIILTCFIFFPAMWVFPLEVVQGVIKVSTQFADDGHLQYFLGKVSRDPGLLFYPIGWLLRTSPLEIVGLFIFPLMIYNFFRQRISKGLPKGNRKVSVLIAMALFVFFFLVFESLSNKKGVRYFLPAFPIISVFAVMSLRQLITYATKARGIRLKQKWGDFLLVGIIILTQGWFVFSHYPYYFTYFNPLMGGASKATQLISVGWGEGLDQAAAYLNAQPNAEKLQVISWYSSAFAPFFKGKSTNVPGDYVVLYINQIQRNQPAAETLHYFLNHRSPEFTVRMHGVNYASVYKMPTVRRGTWEVSGIPGKAFLLGVSESEMKNQPAEGALSLVVYWLNFGVEGDERWWIALQSDGAQNTAWQPCQLRSPFVNEQTMLNAIMESECGFSEVLPAGPYHLLTGLGTAPENIIPVAFAEGQSAVTVFENGKTRLNSFDR